jgi:hypothetical protein
LDRTVIRILGSRFVATDIERSHDHTSSQLSFATSSSAVNRSYSRMSTRNYCVVSTGGKGTLAAQKTPPISAYDATCTESPDVAPV